MVKVKRTIDRVGNPIDHDIGKQLVFGDARFDMAVAIGPGMKLFYNPGCQAQRGIT